jgi:hypothetical protein
VIICYKTLYTSMICDTEKKQGTGNDPVSAMVNISNLIFERSVCIDFAPATNKQHNNRFCASVSPVRRARFNGSIKLHLKSCSFRESAQSSRLPRAWRLSLLRRHGCPHTECPNILKSSCATFFKSYFLQFVWKPVQSLPTDPGEMRLSNFHGR